MVSAFDIERQRLVTYVKRAWPDQQARRKPKLESGLSSRKNREQTGFRLKTSKSVTPAINRLRNTQETRKMY